MQGKFLSNNAAAVCYMFPQDPVSPLHGYTVLANYRGQNRAGSVATVKCNPGYVLYGDQDSVCGDTGTWQSVGGETRAGRATCELVTCPHPPDVDNTHMELLNDTLTWGAVILYTCQHSSIRDVSRCLQGVCYSGLSFSTEQALRRFL